MGSYHFFTTAELFKKSFEDAYQDKNVFLKKFEEFYSVDRIKILMGYYLKKDNLKLKNERCKNICNEFHKFFQPEKGPKKEDPDINPFNIHSSWSKVIIFDLDLNKNIESNSKVDMECYDIKPSDITFIDKSNREVNVPQGYIFITKNINQNHIYIVVKYNILLKLKIKKYTIKKLRILENNIWGDEIDEN